MAPEPSLWDQIIGWVLGIILVGGGIGAAISERIRGVVILVIIVSLAVKFFFFSGDNSANSPSQTSTSIKTVPGSPETVTTTIQNYRFKGDDVKIQCSGPTGAVVCKPAQ